MKKTGKRRVAIPMHDIWNPWHGCTKISEGCEHCYMYFLDRQRGQDGAQIRRVASGFDMPVKKDRRGYYKILSGERVRVCMNSDFFLAEADLWRKEAWQIMKKRSDVIFFLLTKRPERVAACLPADWGTGWENIFFNVTVENQKRAESRMDWLLKLPFQHKGVMCAPLIGPVAMARQRPDRTGDLRRGKLRWRAALRLSLGSSSGGAMPPGRGDF